MVKKENKGKQFDLKIKPFLIYEYLKQATDENHFVSAETIKGYIEEFGISTSIPSIYRDIEEINKAILLARGEAETLKEAEEKIYKYGDKYKTIICVRKKGYRINHRKYDFEDVRLMVECIYASRFISKEKSETLTELLKEFVSEDRYNEVKHDVEVIDRAKVLNDQVFNNVTVINNAMRRTLKHTPSKIRFKYMTISPKDRKTKIERRNGRFYVVSPYKLIINDVLDSINECMVHLQDTSIKNYINKEEKKIEKFYMMPIILSAAVMILVSFYVFSLIGQGLYV